MCVYLHDIEEFLYCTILNFQIFKMLFAHTLLASSLAVGALAARSVNFPFQMLF